jgi:hypothetical protein
MFSQVKEPTERAYAVYNIQESQKLVRAVNLTNTCVITRTGRVNTGVGS